jgi:hypothetical protein
VTRRELLARAALAIPLLAALGARGAAAPAPSPRLVRATAAMGLATLAERIAKLHAQIGQGVLTQRSRRGLAEAFRGFEAALASLLAQPHGPELRESLAVMGPLWRDYRAWAQRAPTREHARKLGERTEEVVWVAMKVVRAMQDSADRSPANALAAAEACTLAQRIPRLHLWMRWGIDAGASAEAAREARGRLAAILERLRGSASDTPEIGAQLQLADNQAAFLEQAVAQLQSGADAARPLEFLAKTGDHILESLERVVSLYEGRLP